MNVVHVRVNAQKFYSVTNTPRNDSAHLDAAQYLHYISAVQGERAIERCGARGFSNMFWAEVRLDNGEPPPYGVAR